MRVQRVLMPDESESWTVLDGGGEPVGEVEAFLAHLQALDRSPTTLRTYATSLKLWLQFLEPLGVAVDEATVENVSRFVGWLRAPAENVAVLDVGTGRCCAATVNRHLAALFSFYDSGPRAAWCSRSRWWTGDGPTGVATGRSCITSPLGVQRLPGRCGYASPAACRAR